MKRAETLQIPHKIGKGISPTTADWAIVSIDKFGTPGKLNTFVLREYEFTEDDIPSIEQLKVGFSLLLRDNRKPILFVVTVDGGNTSENLQNNLFDALVEFREVIASKEKVWLPLMGTGDGGLSLDESFSITISVLNRFYQEHQISAMFLISVPNDKTGVEFWDKIKSDYETETETEVEVEIEVKVENAFSSFIGSFFTATANWEHEDQYKRFIENSIWESNKNDEYISIIKSVNKGDIIFLNSADPSVKSGNLRITAVGQVVENFGTGYELSVDWKIRDISIDIEKVNKYRRTFEIVNQEDLEIFLQSIGKQKIFEAGLLNLNNEISEIGFTYADLIADTISGDDYLDIESDVLAFSRFIAAKSFNPPLAIALFGKWGSGKSFFMDKLKTHIQFLSGLGGESPYCSGIAHIHFNAWSYLDANLWAGMVTRIFEGLNEYISNDTKANTVKREIEKELAEQLNITKTEVELLEKQKDVIDYQISEFETKKKKLSDELKENIKKIENKSLKVIISKVDEQFKIKSMIEKDLNEAEIDYLNNLFPEKYWSNPVELSNQIHSNVTFLKEFFNPRQFGSTIVISVIILIIIITSPIFIDTLKSINLVVPQLLLSASVIFGAFWKRAVTVIKKFEPLWAHLWSIKADYEQQLKDAVFKHEQEEKALQLKIEQVKTEIQTINEKIQQAQLTKDDLDFRINNALATEALYSFIEKRSSSNDYQKYLGIISIIRKDFEIMSSLFLEHHDEFDSKEMRFRGKFDRPLQRIILYIDDLDRCPEERVVEVLEAVNLLMAFPLFVVVVGVDPKWIKNALIKRYQLQFTGQLNGSGRSSDLEIVEAANYLEKIFQVPFHLKEASDKSVKFMLKTLSSPKNGKRATSDADPDLEIISEKGKISDSDYEVEENSLETNTSVIEPFETIHTVSITHHTSLELTEREIEIIQDLSPLIGSNPRAIKRFVNIYKIVRAHEELQSKNKLGEKEYLVMMFLLALSIGPFQQLLPVLNNYLLNSKTRVKNLGKFLNSKSRGVNELTFLIKLLDLNIKNNPTLILLRDEPFTLFNSHNPFIQRFTFKDQ